MDYMVLHPRRQNSLYYFNLFIKVLDNNDEANYIQALQIKTTNEQMNKDANKDRGKNNILN
jgi:hypothetical protein